ncbi:MAG: CRTAC1 family protein [Opitutaceae bacterium]
MPRLPEPLLVSPRRIEPIPSLVSPLLPVLLPLVLAAIVISAAFARVFPRATGGDTPRLRFTDVTAESGLRFTHQQGGPDAPTTLGGAVAVLDYNNDGAPDLFFVNGSPWPWEESLEKRPGRSSALFRNDGGGHFADVTASAGLNVEMQGMGVTAGDFDNDGLPDLYVTCVGRNHLFRNLGQGHFEDITDEANVGGDDSTWSSGALWLDVDGDGHLDLIVLHYARWLSDGGLKQAFSIANIGRTYGTPVGFSSAFPTVYRNLGHGRFAPIAGSAGLRDLDPDTGRAVAQPLAIAPLDANGDGRLDVLITYQNTMASLFLARADGTFAKQSALPSARREGATASLASTSALVSDAEVGSDLRPALLTLLVAGLDRREGQPLALATKLGVATADFNLDGYIEVFSGQGAAELHLNKFESGRDFGRVPAVLERKDGHWSAIAWDAANTWMVSLTARGVAAADFDGDGDSDIVIAQNNAAPLFLRNDQRVGSPWLRIRLIATRTQRDAGGARVEVHMPRRVFVQTMAPALGFLAQSDSTLTFGLGDDTRVRKIVIRWPSGRRQELRPGELNRTLVVREP